MYQVFCGAFSLKNIDHVQLKSASYFTGKSFVNILNTKTYFAGQHLTETVLKAFLWPSLLISRRRTNSRHIASLVPTVTLVS